MARLKGLHVFLRGGLGNQLFQYSFGLDLAQRNNRQLVLRGDLLPTAQDSVGGVSRWPNQIANFGHLGIMHTKSHQPPGETNLFSKFMQISRSVGDVFPHALEIVGMLASERNPELSPLKEKRIKVINSYCALKNVAWKNRAELNDQISNILNPSPQFLSMLEDMKSKPTTSVHIRQGDYLELVKIYGKLSETYYTSALKNLSDSGAISRTWIFTDSAETIPSEILRVIEPERIIAPQDLPSPIENLIVMSKSSEFIASNSTFSWWSCLLGSKDKKVIAPIINQAKVNIFSLEQEPAEDWTLLNV